MNKNKKEIIKSIIDADAKPIVDLKIEYGDKEIIIKVKQQISFEEKMNVIKEIYGFTCNVEDDDSTSISLDNYQPYLREYAKRFSVIIHYTDLDLELTSGGDAKLINELVMNTSLFDKVLEIAGKDIRYIFDSADELIDNYKEAAIRGNNFISVLNIFTKYLNNFSDFDINSILKILEKFKGFDTQNLLNKINSEIK